MVERKPNEVKIVAWLLVAKKLIKFANDETSYKISDKVMAANDFAKFPLPKGSTVEVGINEGVVTFLRKQKSESKTSEEIQEPTPNEEKPKAVAPTPAPAPKVEEPKKEDVTPSVVGEVKELTIFAVSANKRVVKFLECKDAGWFQIDPSIQAKDYQEIGLIAKNKAKVQIVENNVVSFEKVAVEAPVAAPQSTPEARSEEKKAETTTSLVKAAEAPKKEWKPYSQNPDVQKSIECQACVNSASNLVGMVAANIDPKPTASVINAMIRAIATENYNLLQELKSK